MDARQELIEALDGLIASCERHGEICRAVSEDCSRKNEESRAARAEAEARRASEALMVREEPTRYGDPVIARMDRFEQTLGAIARNLGLLKEDVATLRLDVGTLKQDVGTLKQDVGTLKQDVATVKERMATKVELDGVRNTVKMVADGYTDAKQRLADVAELLKRHVIAP